jgi:hypothetical protein
MTTSPLSRIAAVRHLILIAAALAALAALALPVAETSAASGPAFGLRVFTGDNPNLLTFHSANCSVGKKNGFEAFAHLNGWRLLVGIRPFTGFHRYALVRGRFTGTFLDLSAPNGANEYASDFVPPHHIPSGGEINFSDHGSLMGGGFYPMFNEPGTDAVGVAGGLQCHYPKKKRRR